MSKQSFNIDKSIRLKPIDPSTIMSPKNGELIVDSTDSNKLKKYNESTSSWETDTSKLSVSGGTMTGALAMDTNKITGLGTPTANTDAATKAYVDTAVAAGGGGSSTPVDTAISALDVNWSSGDTFYKLISTSSTFTFSNTINGKTVSVILKNTSSSSITVTFPVGILTTGTLNTTIQASKENIYTFIKSNDKLYVNVCADLG